MSFMKNVAVIFWTFAFTITTMEAQEINLYSSSRTEHIWQQLEPGLEFGVFLSPQLSEIGDSLIRVLRINPKYFELRLLNASAFEQHQLYTTKEWCLKYDLVAAINASMYQEDYRTSVSLMRTKDHINNPRLSKDKTILAFDRKSSRVPLVKMIDRQCENFDDWKEQYATFVQSIRMISCTGKNVWRQQPHAWSTALIGTDQVGRVLFIHVRSPYSTHDVINILLQLPLQTSRAMYAEGGQEAQLYIRSDEQAFEFVGTYPGGFRPTNSARPIPNVVGIARRNPHLE